MSVSGPLDDTRLLPAELRRFVARQPLDVAMQAIADEVEIEFARAQEAMIAGKDKSAERFLSPSATRTTK